jgi:hypothetical protein
MGYYDGMEGTDAPKSNTVTTTMPGRGVSGDSAGQPYSNAAATRKLVVAVNGAYPPFGHIHDMIGNRWFEFMTKETGASIKTGGGAYDERYYFSTALRGLLDAIDANHDQTITATEAADVKIVLTGYSWGGISVANISRLLRKDRITFPEAPEEYTTYTLNVDVQVDLLLMIDPVRNGPFGAARLLKPLRGPVETNVKRMVNWYQRRGGGTRFGLYLPQTSENGALFGNPIYELIAYQQDEVINPPFGGLKADPIPNNLDASQVEQINLSTLGNRFATNVEYFRDPLDGTDPRREDNWFDANLTASQVQHDTVPFFIRGGLDPFTYPDALNWLKEVALA